MTNDNKRTSSLKNDSPPLFATQPITDGFSYVTIEVLSIVLCNDNNNSSTTIVDDLKVENSKLYSGQFNRTFNNDRYAF